MTVNVYQPGDEVSVTIAVTDSTGTAYDPYAVKFHYTDPAGTDYTKIYGTDSVATKTSTGHYKLVIYVPYTSASVGYWEYDAQALDSGGNSLLVEPGRFYVQKLKTL